MFSIHANLIINDLFNVCILLGGMYFVCDMVTSLANLCTWYFSRVIFTHFSQKKRRLGINSATVGKIELKLTKDLGQKRIRCQSISIVFTVVGKKFKNCTMRLV